MGFVSDLDFRKRDQEKMLVIFLTSFPCMGRKDTGRLGKSWEIPSHTRGYSKDDSGELQRSGDSAS